MIRELLLAAESEGGAATAAPAAQAERVRGASPAPHAASGETDAARRTESLFEKLQESTRASMVSFKRVRAAARARVLSIALHLPFLVLSLSCRRVRARGI